MNKISCEICMDLIPLIQDGAASRDTQEAVAAHTAQCPACHALLTQGAAVPEINDGRVLRTLRRSLATGALIFIVLGIVLGVGLSDSQAVFYNILIMPAIGALSYVAMRKSAFITLIGLFACTYLLPLLQLKLSGQWVAGTTDGLFFWALIYCTLCALGTIIAALLHFAFRKDGKKHEQ